MNNQNGNRDKRIAALLIISFAWLFIGSLIIFHEEHVLGRHFNFASQVFISPKSNDKQYSANKLQQQVQGSDDLAGAVAFLTSTSQVSSPEYFTRIYYPEACQGFNGAICLSQPSLRAPPAA